MTNEKVVNPENDGVVENNVAVDKTTTDKETKTEKIAVESGTLKDKILMRTNKVGMTQDGKLAKGFITGVILTVLVIFGWNRAKQKGYIKIK